MSIQLYLTDGSPLIPIQDKTVDSSQAPITLVGKGWIGSADFLNSNLIHMLENFASTAYPNNPLIGQLWYDYNVQGIKYYAGVGVPGTDAYGWSSALATTDFIHYLPITGGTLVGNSGAPGNLAITGTLTVNGTTTLQGNTTTVTNAFAVNGQTTLQNTTVSYLTVEHDLAVLGNTYAVTTTEELLVNGVLVVQGETSLNGGATSVTPSTSDNSTKIATTAYVKSQPITVTGETLPVLVLAVQ